MALETIKPTPSGLPFPPFLFPFPFDVRWVPLSLSLPVKNTPSPIVLLSTSTCWLTGRQEPFQKSKKWNYTMGSSGSSGDCWIVGDQLRKHQFDCKGLFSFRMWCWIFALILCFSSLFSHGNSAKDFMGVIPLSAPGEDQRKSAQCQSFTALHQRFSVSANRYCRRI